MPDVLQIADLGVVPFRAALALQDRLHAERVRGGVPDTLLLAQHEPVLSRGRGTTGAHLPMGEDWYLGQGLAIVDVDRAGGLTVHGPGQIVGYAVMATRDVPAFGCRTEDALVAAVADHGVVATSGGAQGPPRPGVWAGHRKLASLGLRHTRGVTTHGFSLNVANDLQPFAYIVEGATAELEATSMSRELRGPDARPVAVDVAAVTASVAAAFATVHDRTARMVDMPV